MHKKGICLEIVFSNNLRSSPLGDPKDYHVKMTWNKESVFSSSGYA